MDVSANTPDENPNVEELSAEDPSAEDVGAQPSLDPVVEARVRGLLATDPDPGPMPTAYVERISAALAEEARLRVHPGPLGRTPGVDPSPTDGRISADDRVLAPLIRQRQRRSPLFAAAAVAAAAAVVVVGGSALHLNKRPDAVAAMGDTPTTVSSQGTSGPVAEPPMHIQQSRTAYDAANLPRLARELLTSPGVALHDLAAEAPSIGPIGTALGVVSCLDAIGATDRDRGVSVDLATYEGKPAAVIVTRGAGGAVAYVVERSCPSNTAMVIRGATPVP